MFYQMTGSAEPLITVGAGIVLLRRVSQDVVLQRTNASKLALALRAGVRPFSGMNSHVGLQVVRFGKLPGAYGTGRHLFASMGTEVLLHGAQRSKAAAAHQTDVPLHLRDVSEDMLRQIRFRLMHSATHSTIDDLPGRVGLPVPRHVFLQHLLVLVPAPTFITHISTRG